jgi:hypothetical protein
MLLSRNERRKNMKELNEKLKAIQSELIAPKSQFNSFGKYSYRSCEDILEAVKPLLNKNGLSLTLHDEVVQIGDRFYVKSIAVISDGNDKLGVSAYAREAETKKGMDESQITGASSSYARKYALNGLFCIDDTKDADSTNKHNGNGKKVDHSQLNNLRDLLIAKGLEDKEGKFCSFFQIEKLEDLPESQYQAAITAIESAKGKNGGAK